LNRHKEEPMAAKPKKAKKKKKKPSGPHPKKQAGKR
jgi:hypothetical protein